MSVVQHIHDVPRPWWLDLKELPIHQLERGQLFISPTGFRVRKGEPHPERTFPTEWHLIEKLIPYMMVDFDPFQDCLLATVLSPDGVLITIPLQPGRPRRKVRLVE